jgi:serine protease Do
MKRTVLLSLIVGVSLTAATLNFQHAPTNPERVVPNTQGTILSYNDAIKNITNSVVHIATTQKPKQYNMPDIHPFFKEFFGPQFRQPQAPKRHGLGSGVIVSKDGYIITNNHVIDEADKIVVTLPDSPKEYDAKVIGKDPKSDLAVIKIEAENLKPIAMGSSSNLKVGDVVFAIGNPFGVGQTVTQGIISAQHKNGVGINEYENFIQTDAPINPGNSGGALVDSRGALIGINTAIITRSGGNNGIGFAIEVDMARDIAQRLVEDGSIERGYLGVSIGNMNKGLRKLYTNQEGALISEVHSGTPADKAGLKRGDLITEINGKKITSSSTLKNEIGRYAPGSEVEVTFERDKVMKTTDVKLDSLSQSGVADGSELFEGISAADIDDRVRAQFRIPGDVDGIVITSVDDESEAAQQGIREGDVIVQIGQWSISSIKDARNALKQYNGEYKKVYIARKGRIYIVALK